MQAKADLRLAMRERLKTLSAKDRDIESRIICKTLQKLIGDAPELVTGYIPLSDEPNILPLLEHILKTGKKIALPTIESDALAFRTVENLGQTIQNPITKLSEPLKTCPRTDPKHIAWVIVPGRAFTKQGDRLGRGNGGFDRWIALQRKENPQTRYVGVCFECQILPTLAIEPHDEKMNIVVTARTTTRM